MFFNKKTIMCEYALVVGENIYRFKHANGIVEVDTYSLYHLDEILKYASEHNQINIEYGDDFLLINLNTGDFTFTFGDYRLINSGFYDVSYDVIWFYNDNDYYGLMCNLSGKSVDELDKRIESLKYATSNTLDVAYELMSLYGRLADFGKIFTKSREDLSNIWAPSTTTKSAK